MKSTNVISCRLALVLTVFEILTFEIVDLENEVKVTEYNTGNVAGKFQMSISVNVIFTF